MAIHWQSLRWDIRATGTGGPGPNRWDARNVQVDLAGDLRLGLVKRGGLWTCAELSTQQKIGFGTYDFDLIARPDKFVPQLVLGIFPYTLPEVGPDTTNEIDIEFARWGDPKNPVGNFTVWPSVKEPGLEQTSHTFPVVLSGDYTSHRFVWTPTEVRFESRHGHGGAGELISSWRFAPSEPLKRIPQKLLPLHLNLWLFAGKAPSDNRPVEVVFRRFKYTP